MNVTHYSVRILTTQDKNKKKKKEGLVKITIDFLSRRKIIYKRGLL